MRFFNPTFIRDYNRYFMKYHFSSRQTDNTVLDVSGVWDTSYGQLVMIQRENRITGYVDSYYDLTIKGSIQSNILTGNWWDYDIEGKNSGQYRLDFSLYEFVGKWGYNNKPLYFSWIGKKLSTTFRGYNCYRYRVIHNSLKLNEVVINEESISYGETTSYFYPEECSDFTEFQLLIAGEIISERIPVEPGFSYTFTIQDTMFNITMDITIDNPF